MVVGTRTRAELITLLDDLVHRMRSAAERFDQGRLLEGEDLADHIRKLFHHNDQAQALIDQLGLQNHLTWVDTAGVPNPKTQFSAACLTLMKIRKGPQAHGEFVPKLGLYPPAPIRTRSGEQIDRGTRIPFDHWWTNPVVKDCDGLEYSRKELVLAVANHDGATHDDPEMKAAYTALTDSSSLGWVAACGTDTAQAAFQSNPVMASVRQIGYEVLQSIEQQRNVIDG